MRFGLDNGVLATDLDAQFFDLLNCHELWGADNVVDITDSRLYDQRLMLDGSVYDRSVAASAGIVQSKLNLNGIMPPNYLGIPADEFVTTGAPGNPNELVTGDDQGTVTVGGPGSRAFYAARGDITQFNTEKNLTNGYPGLGADGKLLPGLVPPSGSGTMTSISFVFPPQFISVEQIEPVVTGGVPPDELVYVSVEGGEIVTAPSTSAIRSFNLLWAPVSSYSWFGGPVPSFTQEAFSEDKIPNLDAAQFTSLTFAPNRLPVAVGVGDNHAIGMLPDSGLEGHLHDYLARDMTWRPMQPSSAIQPVISDPSITIISYPTSSTASVNVTENVPGTNLFHRETPGSAVFAEIITQPLTVAVGTTISAYASKAGWTDSQIVSYTIPPHP